MLDDHRSEYRRFAANLRELRRQAGLSQSEVAALLGKPQSFVSKCETGERRVDVIELLAFAQVYRKSLADFLPK